MTRLAGRSVDLATRLGISPSYLSRLFTKNAEHRRNIGESNAREFEQKLGLATGWLDENHDVTAFAVGHDVGHVHTQGPFEVEPAAAAWLSTHSIAGTTVRYEIAEGDAMAPTILPGDTMLVDHGFKKITADGIYCIRMAGQSFVRRVQRDLDGTISLLPDNERYPKHQVTLEQLESLDVRGKVLSVLRHIQL